MSKLQFTSILPPSSSSQIFPRSLTNLQGVRPSLHLSRHAILSPLIGLSPQFHKDTCRTTTILLVGATLQSILFAVGPARLALLPAALALLTRLVTTLLQANSVLPNPYMDHVIPGKATAQIPAGDGAGTRTALTEQPVTVVLLGMQVNHPLGLFAPGVREIGAYLKDMQTEMEAKADEYGLLGGSNWRADQHRDSSNEILLIFYFRDVEGVNKFAHGPAHRAGWDDYNKKGYKHIGFMHEVFSVPRRAYESVYLNCTPHLLGGTSVKRGVKRVQDEEGNGLERPEWLNPLVPANKGVMRSSFGRLGKTQGKEQEQYGEVPKWHEVGSQ